MKHLTVLLLYVISLSTFSQTIQPCIVLEYNERQNKTPLPNVVLRVKNAGSALSDEKGECSLRFRTLKPGDKVQYSVGDISRKGYEVFNKEALEQWNLTGGKVPYRIVMCRTDRFKKIRDNYEATMSKSYREQRDQDQARLNHERETNQINQTEYERRLQEIKDEYEQRLENIEEYIERFARIDLTEVNETEAKALELIQRGDIEEAIRVYESLNLINKKTQNKAILSSAHKTIEQEWLHIIKCREENEKITESIKKQIDIYKAMGGKAYRYKADSLFHEAAFADTTDIDMLKAYYHYASSRNKQDDVQMVAEILFNHYLKEYQSAPIQGTYKRFTNIEEALEYVQSHKYSVECLKKQDDSYIFDISSKSDFLYSLDTWLDNNKKLSSIEKKKIVNEVIGSGIITDNWRLRNFYISQLNLADSTEKWPIIQEIFNKNLTKSEYYTSTLISIALRVANQKEVESFLLSNLKEKEKGYKRIKSSSNKFLKDKKNIEKRSQTLQSEIDYIRSYAINNLYALWEFYKNAYSTKKLSFYENKIIEADETELYLIKQYNVSKESTSHKVLDNGDSIKFINTLELEHNSYLYRSMYSTMTYFYLAKGDKSKYYQFLRLYSPDDAIVNRCLEEGDTLKAIQFQLEILGLSKPIGNKIEINDSLDNYAKNLEKTCNLYTKINDFVNAERYALLALDIYKKTNKSWRLEDQYYELARIYEKQQKWSEAIHAWIDGKYPEHFYIAKLYWEKLHDAQNALTYLQKALDDYDKKFEETSHQDIMNQQYRNLINYTRDVFLSSGTGTETEWCEFLKKQLSIYDSYILHQEYLGSNNAHLLRSMIISSYSTRRDSVGAKEFLDMRAERIKTIYEANQTESMLYAYGDAVGYDYYAFYRNIHDFDKTEFYALKAVDVYRKVYEEYGNIAPEANMYRELVEVFESIQDYQKSHKYCELAINGYVKLDYHRHLLAYLYIANAWAKFKLFSNDQNCYKEDLEKGRACMIQFENSSFAQKKLILNRIDILSLNSLVANLSSYDSQSNYTGYEDDSHEIHKLRASIINAYEANHDYEGCISFLTRRTEIISQNMKKAKDPTIKYILADAYFDLSLTYLKMDKIHCAIQYGNIAFQEYQDLYERFSDNTTYCKANANMGRFLGNLFINTDSLSRAIVCLEISRLYYEKLAQKDIATYQTQLVNVDQDLAELYSNKSETDSVISCRERLNRNLKILSETDASTYKEQYYINLYSLLHLLHKEDDCIKVSKELLSSYDTPVSRLNYLSDHTPHTIREHIREHSVKVNEIVDLEFFIDRIENLSQFASLNIVEEAVWYMLGDAYYDVFSIYLALNDYSNAVIYGENALQTYQKMQMNDAPCAYMCYLLMNVYEKIGNDELYATYFEKSLSYYNILYSQNPEKHKKLFIELQNLKVIQLLQMNKIDEAILLAKTIIPKDESNIISQFRLAQCYNYKAYYFLKLGDFSNALQSVDKTITMFPEDPDFYDTKGEILLMQGKNEEALAMWKKVLELNPDFLKNYPDGTELSNGLKKLGLIK